MSRNNGSAPARPQVAVSLVLNDEEDGENCIRYGDAASEAFLSDIAGAQPWPGLRHWDMEALYDYGAYGARAGFRRLHRLFTGMALPITMFGVATALARSPEQVAAMKAAGWDIASHGLKWVEHRDQPEDAERRHLAHPPAVPPAGSLAEAARLPPMPDPKAKILPALPISPA